MPRSRSRRERTPGARGAVVDAGVDDGILPRRLRRRLIAGAIGIVLAVAGVWFVARLDASESAFLNLAKAGRPALGTPRLYPDFGNSHLQPLQRANYRTQFSLSGPHADTWTMPGFYDSPVAPETLVHALEHGNIVIYYDAPSEAAMRSLKDWAALYRSMWSGIVVTPMPGLEQAVVLTAWRRMLRLDTFDAALAAAFIDVYRGRGPENPVR